LPSQTSSRERGAAVLIAIILIVGVIFTGVCTLGFVVYRNRLKRLRSVKLSEVADLDEGTGKVYGTVIAVEEPIRSPVTNTHCVYYSLRVEEERVRTETYTERVGNRQVRRTRQVREWHQILEDVRFVSFDVKDDSGKAGVELEHAEITVKSKDRKSTGGTNGLSEKVLNRLERMYPNVGGFLSLKRRYTEITIQEEDSVLVMGEVILTKKGKPIFAYEKKKPLLVSDLTDEQLQKHYKTYAMWLAIGAGFFFVATTVAVILLSMKK
jgi:hypothetical protein